VDALSYRWATPADADELALLNQQLVQDGADFGPDNLEFLTRRMRGWLTDGVHQGVLFLDAQDRTVAYAIHRDNGEEIYLAQFLVVKTARGHGVGHAAIDVLRRHIWQGSKRLVLDVLVSNRHALDFWHQMGWQDCALILEIPVNAASSPDATPAALRSSIDAQSFRAERDPASATGSLSQAA
jgi:GNAT superfamily N-acetyltransferase